MNKLIIIIAFILLILGGFLLKYLYAASLITGGYNDIDNSIYETLKDRRIEDVSDLYETKDNSIILGSGNTKNIKKKHRWYNYDTWQDLRKDKGLWKEYIQDRNYARSHMVFDWKLIFKKVMPLIHCKTTQEYMGVIRAESDGTTLYVHKMEPSKVTSSKGSALRYVPGNIVKKYSSIPGYFLFHTHPANIGGDPFPSDVDINGAVIDTFGGHYVGEIVVSEYGIIIYYLSYKKAEIIYKTSNPELALFQFCYNLIMAWNSVTHKDKFKLTDQIHMMKKYGVIMMVIPTPEYVVKSSLYTFNRPLLTERFRNGQYELLDTIKKIINEIEEEELKKEKKKVII